MLIWHGHEEHLQWVVKWWKNKLNEAYVRNADPKGINAHKKNDCVKSFTPKSKFTHTFICKTTRIAANFNLQNHCKVSYECDLLYSTPAGRKPCW